MSRICDLTGKGYMNGHNVSNSNVKTKRKFYPNLKLKKFYIPEEDKWITLKVSTSAIKTISKNGITACINKFASLALALHKLMHSGHSFSPTCMQACTLLRS